MLRRILVVGVAITAAVLTGCACGKHRRPTVVQSVPIQQCPTQQPCCPNGGQVRVPQAVQVPAAPPTFR